MVAQKQKIAILVMALLSINLIYMIYVNHKFETRLADDQKQCIARAQERLEKYEQELDSIQQEIDRRILGQMETLQSQASNGYLEEDVELQGISRETLGDSRESIKEIIAKKYHFLLQYLKADVDALNELLMLLEEREKIALQIIDSKEYAQDLDVTNDDIWEIEQLLDEVDLQIENLLDPENSYRYAMLKNSDVEQKQFYQYTLGVNGLFPLDSEQQETVLFARLKHKSEFEKALKNSDVEMDYPLTLEQRDNLLKKIEMAAMRYKHAFLMEAREVLDHDSYPMDQYTLLENYTNTEFNKIISNLREKVEERGIVN
jgi:hypothetical protein